MGSCVSSPANHCVASRKSLVTESSSVPGVDSLFSATDQEVNILDFPGHVWSLLNSLLWFYVFVITLEK